MSISTVSNRRLHEITKADASKSAIGNAAADSAATLAAILAALQAALEKVAAEPAATEKLATTSGAGNNGAGSAANANEAVKAFEGVSPPETIGDLNTAAEGNRFNTDIDGDGLTTQRDVDVVKHIIEHDSTFEEANAAVPLLDRELGSDNGFKPSNPYGQVGEEEAGEEVVVVAEEGAEAIVALDPLSLGIVVIGAAAEAAIDSYAAAETQAEKQDTLDTLTANIATQITDLNTHLDTGRPEVDLTASQAEQEEQKGAQRTWDAELVRLNSEIESSLRVGGGIVRKNTNPALESTAFQAQSDRHDESLRTAVGGQGTPTVRDLLAAQSIEKKVQEELEVAGIFGASVGVAVSYQNPNNLQEATFSINVQLLTAVGELPPHAQNNLHSAVRAGAERAMAKMGFDSGNIGPIAVHDSNGAVKPATAGSGAANSAPAPAPAPGIVVDDWFEGMPDELIASTLGYMDPSAAATVLLGPLRDEAVWFLTEITMAMDAATSAPILAAISEQDDEQAVAILTEIATADLALAGEILGGMPDTAAAGEILGGMPDIALAGAILGGMPDAQRAGMILSGIQDARRAAEILATIPNDRLNLMLAATTQTDIWLATLNNAVNHVADIATMAPDAVAAFLLTLPSSYEASVTLTIMTDDQVAALALGISDEDAVAIMHELAPSGTSRILGSMTPERAAAILGAVAATGTARAAGILEAMTDIARIAEILAAIPDTARAIEIFNMLTPEKAEAIRTITGNWID